MIYIAVLDENNNQLGQFTRAQIAQKLQSGEISLDNLAFAPGMNDWTPLRAVLAKVDSNQLRTPPSNRAAAASSGYSDYAGFWRRFAAHIIDCIVLVLISVVLVAIVGLLFPSTQEFIMQGGSPSSRNHHGSHAPGKDLASLVVGWLYYALHECGADQATPGKKMLGIRVTDLDGNQISFARATGRYFGKVLSAFILCIGFIMVAFTERKQGLHDMMAGTLVVKG